MLISLKELFDKYDVHPKKVVQVGAHWAEEHEELLRCGVEEFLYVEPCKEAMEHLVSKFKHDLSVGLRQVACGNYVGRSAMYTSHENQGQSNSLLEPYLHLEQHPEIKFGDAEAVDVLPLDIIVSSYDKYDTLIMDVQGYEGEVVKGATNVLPHIKAIYTECNRGQTYKGNMEIDEMDEFLKPFGFERIETYWPSPSWTWGDCLYTKK